MKAAALFAITVVLAWTMPTTNEDGSPLSDLAGARAYWGTVSGTYTGVVDVGMETNATITNLVENTDYFFAATAYDLVGNESDFSVEVAYTPSLPPSPPFNLEIGITNGMVLLQWQWDGDGQLAGFAIHRSCDGGQSWNQVAEVGPGARRWLEDSLSMLYAVSAVDGIARTNVNEAAELPPLPSLSEMDDG